MSTTAEIYAELLAEGLGTLVSDLPDLARRMRTAALPETDIAILVIVRDVEDNYRALSYKREELLHAIREGDPGFSDAIRLLGKYRHPGDTCIVIYHEAEGGSTASYILVFETTPPAKEGAN